MPLASDPTHVLALLIFFHLLADYPLQGDFMARAKNPLHPLPHTPWRLILLSHATIHGGFVFLATGSLTLATLELATHHVIDEAKCRGRLTYAQDQALHLACKLLWWFAWLTYPVPYTS